MALIIAYLNVLFSATPQWYDWLLAFVNACLLFCSALGLNEIVLKSGKSQTKDPAVEKQFFRSWL
jgi:hypothetical protein